MATNTIRIDAAPEDVYAVLSDADAYGRWVVGAKRIRGSDPQWPASGARFHHEVGAGPLTIKDSSEITAKSRDRRVDLEVRFRPVGIARVRLDLVPVHDGRATLVKMSERPSDGPVRWVWRPLDTVVVWRNAWSLRRLRRLVEARARAAPR